MKKFLCILIVLTMANRISRLWRKTDCQVVMMLLSKVKLPLLLILYPRTKKNSVLQREMVKKYGSDKIVHELWPDNFMQEQEQMISVLGKISCRP